MKPFAAIILVLALAFAGFKMTQTPSVATVKAVQQENKTVPQENMTQFSNDFEKYLGVYAEKKSKGEMPADLVDISAKCKPNQGAYHTRCWVTITGPLGNSEKSTIENVRRVGDKFVWHHET